MGLLGRTKTTNDKDEVRKSWSRLNGVCFLKQKQQQNIAITFGWENCEQLSTRTEWFFVQNENITLR